VWNGYECRTENRLGVLEWEGIGADKLKIVSSPVNLKNKDFDNVVNQYREWSWNGPEPLNERPNVFVGIIEINQRHNFTYNGTIPFDMIHKL